MTILGSIQSSFIIFPSMNELDQVVLNFNEDNLFLMNISLGFIMFGVALQLTPKDFFLVFKEPKSVLVGFCSQFLVLPFLTFLLVLIFSGCYTSVDNTVQKNTSSMPGMTLL